MIDFSDILKKNYIKVGHTPPVLIAQAQYYKGEWYIQRHGQLTLLYLLSDLQESFKEIFKNNNSLLSINKLLKIIERSYEHTTKSLSTQYILGEFYREKWGVNTLEYLMDDIEDFIEELKTNTYKEKHKEKKELQLR